MTPDNYIDFMKTLADEKSEGGRILKPKYDEEPGYNELYKLVVIKDVIAEYIWYVMGRVPYYINIIAFNSKYSV